MSENYSRINSHRAAGPSIPVGPRSRQARTGSPGCRGRRRPPRGRLPAAHAGPRSGPSRRARPSSESCAGDPRFCPRPKKPPWTLLYFIHCVPFGGNVRREATRDERGRRAGYICLRAYRASPNWSATSATTTPNHTQPPPATNWRMITAKINTTRACSHPRHGCGNPLYGTRQGYPAPSRR
jgi:hypothetical protein